MLTDAFTIEFSLSCAPSTRDASTRDVHVTTNLTVEMRKLASTFTNEEIEDKVRKVVVNYLQSDPGSVKPESRFVDDLGADSLDLTELAVAFEDEFNLEIPDSDFGQLSTVAGVVTYIGQRLGAGADKT